MSDNLDCLILEPAAGVLPTLGWLFCTMVSCILSRVFVRGNCVCFFVEYRGHQEWLQGGLGGREEISWKRLNGRP